MTNYAIQALRFVLLLLLQVLVLNQVVLMESISPYVYPLFIILLPISINSIQALMLSFALGICMDFFQDTGGVHAAACLCIAYIRPLVLRFSFGINYDYQTLKLQEEGFKQRFTYMGIMVVGHHLVLFSLEFYSFEYLFLIFQKTLYASVFSLFMILLIVQLIRKTR